MLELRKKSLFSRDYVAIMNNKVVTELSRSLWRARGEMEIDGQLFNFQRDGILKSTFILMKDDQVIVEVQQPSSFKSRMVLRYSDSEYELVRKAWYSQSYLLFDKQNNVGQVQRKSILSSTAIVDMPEAFPLSLNVFLGWVVLVRWDEDKAYDGGG